MSWSASKTGQSAAGVFDERGIALGDHPLNNLRAACSMCAGVRRNRRSRSSRRHTLRSARPSTIAIQVRTRPRTSPRGAQLRCTLTLATQGRERSSSQKPLPGSTR